MEKLPVIEVSEENFVSVLPAIRDAISKASFVAIDCVSISLLWTLCIIIIIYFLQNTCISESANKLHYISNKSGYGY